MKKTMIFVFGSNLRGFHGAGAPLFKNASENCEFDSAWEQWLPGKKFWGTF